MTATPLPDELELDIDDMVGPKGLLDCVAIAPVTFEGLLMNFLARNSLPLPFEHGY